MIQNIIPSDFLSGLDTVTLLDADEDAELIRQIAEIKDRFQKQEAETNATR